MVVQFRSERFKMLIVNAINLSIFNGIAELMQSVQVCENRNREWKGRVAVSVCIFLVTDREKGSACVFSMDFMNDHGKRKHTIEFDLSLKQN